MNDKPLYATDIMKRLPHRYPFLLIDRIIQQDGNKVVALKNVTINEPYFVGHFPVEPIMPGILIGEAMAQTAAFIGTGEELGGGNRENTDPGLGDKAFLTTLNLKLEQPVRPGDQLIITARLIKRLGKLMKISAVTTVDKIPVASAEITVALV